MTDINSIRSSLASILPEDRWENYSLQAGLFWLPVTMRRYVLLLVFGIASCSQAPTDAFLEDFKQNYGNLSNIQELIFEETFASSSYASRYDVGSHYYDYRSGAGRSRAPVYVDTDGGIRLYYDNSVSLYKNITGIRTKNGVISSAFKPGNGRSIFVRFEAALDDSSPGQYNKLVLTLNTEDTPTKFTMEPDAAQKCETETTGKGTAFVVEADGSQSKRFLRVEKMSGSIEQMGTYDSGTTNCTANSSFAANTYGTVTTDSPEPYTDAGPYPKTTLRFMALNPGEYTSGTNPVSINYATIEYSNTELPTATLESYNEHVIEIQPDSTVKWTAYGKTTTITAFKNSAGLEFGSGYQYFSLKMSQDGLAADSSTIKTRIRKIQVTLGESTAN